MTAPPVARGKGKRSERVRGFGFLSGIVCVLGAENRHGLAVSVTTLPPLLSLVSMYLLVFVTTLLFFTPQSLESVLCNNGLFIEYVTMS